MSMLLLFIATTSPDTLPVTIRRIIDGDSLAADFACAIPAVCHDQRLRIAGIDTPELRAPDPCIRALARAASAQLANLIPPGSSATIVPTGRDRYGRLVAAIQCSSGDVASLLLAAGLARPWPVPATWQSWGCPTS